MLNNTLKACEYGMRFHCKNFCHNKINGCVKCAVSMSRCMDRLDNRLLFAPKITSRSHKDTPK